MSYNVDHAEYLTGGPLLIRRGDMLDLKERHKDNLPDFDLLYDLRDRGPEDEMLEIKRFRWSGEGSGYGYREVLPEILGKTKGVAEIVFHWEHGDNVSALRVADGEIEEREVVITTKPKEGKK